VGVLFWFWQANEEARSALSSPRNQAQITERDWSKTNLFLLCIFITLVFYVQSCLGFAMML
jgi:hypothetical protein